MEIIDKTQEVIDKTTGVDEGASPAPAADKIDGASSDKVVDTKNELDRLLSEKGFDSMEELEEALERGTELTKEIGDRDLKDILEKAATLEHYEEQWKIKDEQTLKETEEPEETVKRLEKALKDEQSKTKLRDDERRRQVEAQANVTKYDKLVRTEIAGITDIPAEHRPVVEMLMGVNNPAIDIDIADTRAVKKMVKDIGKKVSGFEQAVIKRYRDGKVDVPVITKTDPAPSDLKENQPKNIREATKIASEKLLKHFRK